MVNLAAASLDASMLLVTLLAISIPWLYHKVPHSPTESPYRITLSVFIVIHSLFVLRTTIVSAPPNIFRHLNIPLNAPTQVIRAALLRNAYPGRDSKWNDDLEVAPPLPAPLETLLKTLGSFELRPLYVRFGHTVIQDCDYCRTYGEFALYALPIALLSYIREAAVVGIVTIKGTRRERLRTLGMGLLIGAAVAEGYWISTAHITVPENGEAVTMWHDILWALRQVLFLLLPLVLHFLPPSPPFAENPLFAISSIVAKFDNVLTKIHLLKYTRGAVMRTPELRKRAGRWWEEDKRVGEWVRLDEGVKNMAEKLGMGFHENRDGREQDGKLRSVTKAAVEILKNGFTPSEFWKPSSA